VILLRSQQHFCEFWNVEVGIVDEEDITSFGGKIEMRETETRQQGDGPLHPLSVGRVEKRVKLYCDLLAFLKNVWIRCFDDV
jgi:hypothetical protein